MIAAIRAPVARRSRPYESDSSRSHINVLGTQCSFQIRNGDLVTGGQRLHVLRSRYVDQHAASDDSAFIEANRAWTRSRCAAVSPRSSASSSVWSGPG